MVYLFDSRPLIQFEMYSAAKIESWIVTATGVFGSTLRFRLHTASSVAAKKLTGVLRPCTAASVTGASSALVCKEVLGPAETDRWARGRSGDTYRTCQSEEPYSTYCCVLGLSGAFERDVS